MYQNFDIIVSAVQTETPHVLFVTVLLWAHIATNSYLTENTAPAHYKIPVLDAVRRTVTMHCEHHINHTNTQAVADVTTVFDGNSVGTKTWQGGSKM